MRITLFSTLFFLCVTTVSALANEMTLPVRVHIEQCGPRATLYRQCDRGRDMCCELYKLGLSLNMIEPAADKDLGPMAREIVKEFTIVEE